MLSITEFQCEICNCKYKYAEDAIRCEERGAVDQSLLPLGLLKPYYHHGYVGAFALAKINTLPHNKHLVSYSFWACRKSYGDNIGDELCGSGALYDSNNALNEFISEDTEKHLDRPEFVRLITALRTKKITPCYYKQNGILITIK